MAQAFGAKAEVEFTQGIPSVYNDPALTQRVMDYTSELLGEKVPEMRRPFSGSDDLSELSQAAPTCYLLSFQAARLKRGIRTRSTTRVSRLMKVCCTAARRCLPMRLWNGCVKTADIFV